MTQNETFAKRPLLPNFCVPDERDLLTASKSGIFDLNLNPALAGSIFQRSQNYGVLLLIDLASNCGLIVSINLIQFFSAVSEGVATDLKKLGCLTLIAFGNVKSFMEIIFFNG